MTEYKLHRVKFIQYQPKAINSVAFDTCSLVPRCALAREDGTIEIRKPSSNWCVERIIPGQEDRTVEHLGWCNKRLFSGGLNGEIIEWDLEKLQPKYNEDSNGGPVWCFRFNHLKTLLAVGCEDGSIRMFEVMHDSILYKNSLYKQENRILSLAWSHDDSILVAGGFDSSIQVYDAQRGNVISRMTTNDKKETIIWSVEVLQDGTVVTGDSLGCTQFWDSCTGTLLQKFNSHEADVLALAASEDGRTIYSSGIDSKIVKFSLVEMEGFNKWDKSIYHRPCDHDIRALAIYHGKDQYIVAAGVHPSFTVYNGCEKSNIPKSVKVYSYLPQRDVCYLAPAANQLMFREHRKLHIWQLGNSELAFACSRKLCEIKCEDKNHIVCSAISNAGEYVAYSTVKKAKLVRMPTSEKASIEKVRIQLEPMSAMSFTKDSKFLVGTIFDKALQVIDFENVDLMVIPILQSEKVSLPFQNLVCSQDSQHLCLIDSSSNCFVFSFNAGEVDYKTKVPKLESQITSCSFKPNNRSLILATNLKSLCCFDLITENLLDLPQKNEVSKVLSINFNPKQGSEMFVQSENYFSKFPNDILNCEDEETPKKKRRLVAKKTAEMENKMLFFGFNKHGEIVIVEHSESEFVKTLPQPLKIKKFKAK